MGEVSERSLASEKGTNSGTSSLTKPTKVNKKKLRKLSLKDFDIDWLRQLTLEGRVYIDMPQVVDKNAYKREILEYVHAIDDNVTEAWKGQMDEVWNAIVDAECFSEFLVLKRGDQSGHMNRYTVTNLVRRMQNLGVYRKDVSMLTLHLRLEHTTKKNKYYKNNRNYRMPSEAREFLKIVFLREGLKKNDCSPESSAITLHRQYDKEVIGYRDQVRKINK